MSRGLALAWLTGLGILSWREVKAYHKPVPAGRLAAASGVFALLGLLSEYQPAAGVAAVTAWGFNLAILLELPLTPASPAARSTSETPSGPQPPPPPTPAGA